MEYAHSTILIMNARTPLPIKAIAGTIRYGLNLPILSGIEYIQSPNENPAAETSSAVGPNRRKCQRTPRGGVSVFAKRLFMCWARSHQVNIAGMRVNEIAMTSQNTTEPTGDSTGSTESLPSSCHRTMCKPWLSVQKSHLARARTKTRCLVSYVPRIPWDTRRRKPPVNVTSDMRRVAHLHLSRIRRVSRHRDLLCGCPRVLGSCIR